jgi:hypothetical protein
MMIHALECKRVRRRSHVARSDAICGATNVRHSGK